MIAITAQRERERVPREGREGSLAPEDRERERDWVAVQELKLSYYIGETLLFIIYPIMVT